MKCGVLGSRTDCKLHANMWKHKSSVVWPEGATAPPRPPPPPIISVLPAITPPLPLYQPGQSCM